jgi:NodT family efflux transporter outer membrane factor (OMF) lipoprotein
MSRWIVVVSMVIASGCAVGPAYKRPTMAVPAAFKEQSVPQSDGGATWKAAEPRDEVVKGDWWEAFGDPQLNTLERQVAISNQNVAQAEAEFRAARAAIRGARAGLFPTVSAGASVVSSRVSTSRSSANVDSSRGSTVDYQLPIDFSYEIDLWGGIRRSVEASRAIAQAGAADLETIRLSMQSELAMDYFELRGLDAERQLLDSTVAAYEKALQLTVDRHDQGVASGSDVAQARTQLDTTRAQATDRGVARAQFEHAIAILMGKAPADLTIAPDPMGGTPPVIPTVLPSELVERRPDVAASERRVAAANAQIGVAKSAFFPQLNLGGSAGLEGTTIASLFSWPSRFWSIGPSLVATVFDGGRRRAVTEQAVANYDASVAVYRQNVLTAFQDVEDNLVALRVLGDEASQQADAVASAEQSLALATTRYQSGVTPYLEVITAQSAALGNEVAAVGILTRRMTATVLLVKAIGGKW